jgi:hypothetical protein
MSAAHNKSKPAMEKQGLQRLGAIWFMRKRAVFSKVSTVHGMRRRSRLPNLQMPLYQDRKFGVIDLQ